MYKSKEHTKMEKKYGNASKPLFKDFIHIFVLHLHLETRFFYLKESHINMLSFKSFLRIYIVWKGVKASGEIFYYVQSFFKSINKTFDILEERPVNLNLLKQRIGEILFKYIFIVLIFKIYSQYIER